ncbi:hypothetical protein BCL76_115117 [Streptomyces sp. CG 926]|uniref:hypothetical protein n=1 Tax=Streptomyces sp. CG 926 TaxID=1882405 RepID=UPI000D6B6C78|nr:hypothetical protein [Streptomyces sp. CG 926]PWK64473.1 hypothetical protein BCL76_115117 [Streptomyces sp. CG 926]
MYEPHTPEPSPPPPPHSTAGRAEHAVSWLTEGEEAERTLAQSLDDLPNERDDRLARMAALLQATARGLDPRAAAVWADVPEHLVHSWLAQDPAFAAAIEAATALARAHGAQLPGRRTPAAIRVAVLAVSRGADRNTAAQVAGLKPHEFRKLRKASPLLEVLVGAARARRSKSSPSSYLRRRAGDTAPSGGFRLIQRDNP